MYVPEINEVKEVLVDLTSKGIVQAWELPYENLLTRRSAAIFFLTPSDKYAESVSTIWEYLDKYENFSFRANEEQKLSKLQYRVTFSREEKEKNESKQLGELAQNA